jgi:hypothetical protein
LRSAAPALKGQSPSHDIEGHLDVAAGRFRVRADPIRVPEETLSDGTIDAVQADVEAGTENEVARWRSTSASMAISPGRAIFLLRAASAIALPKQADQPAAKICSGLATEFDVSLAQGLAATGRLAEGVARIDETTRRVAAKGDVIYLRSCGG